MTEHPGLKTPGRAIRAAREAREMSLAELSERTKIPPPVLEALEADEYHKVSGALYIKSFLRTCAAELGLEAEEILALYGGGAGNEQAAGGGVDTVWQEDEVQISRVGLPWRGLGLAGLALVLVGIGVIVLVRGCGGAAEPAAETPTERAAAARPGADPDVGIADAGAAPVEAAQSTATAGDTLAGGWAAEAPHAEPKADRQEPAADPAGKPAAPDRAAAAEAPVRSAPLPVVGGPHLVFAGGVKFPVVVRVIADRPLGIEVKRDAATGFAAARWPDAGAEAPRLPATGVEPGRVYGSSRGLVVYWGAEDHLSLRLERTDGVEVSLNGGVRNIRNLRPGGELLLDAHGD